MDVNLDTNFVLLIWKVLFVTAALVQLVYFIFVYGRLALHKPAQGNAHLPGVSVVIAARNEYDNLQENLPLILDQDYPNFEVIVVNDGSWDDSKALLHTMQRTHKALHVVNIAENERFDGGKKLAITVGLKAARHDRVLLTDADCRPSGKNWIRAMVAAAGQAEDIVLGYSPYTRMPGVLNAIIRYDSMYTALQYMGFALAGAPYMGVGRNLSYPRTSFFAIGGFRDHYSLPSGDDDLFINQIARADNTRICLSDDAIMETQPETTWKNFWRQKRRHLTTGWRYRGMHRFLLAMQPLSLLLLLIAGIGLLLQSEWLYVVLSVLLLRVLLQIIIFSRSARYLGQKDLVFLAPLLEIVTLVFTTCVHVANASSKQTRWKT